MARILVIEDDETLRFTLRRSLRQAGHEVSEAASVSAGMDSVRQAEPDLILTDVNLGPENGIDLIGRLRGEGYQGAVIVMTGYSSVETAVRAMKVGADDYIQKPVSLEELSIQVERLIEQRRLRTRLRVLERAQRTESREIVGESEAWRSTLALADRLAGVSIDAAGSGRAGGAVPTILLLGETGTGKGLLARRIHDTAAGLREGRDGGGAETLAPPFVHVNTSALPATLIEAELFGHEKGAFTDAKGAREGCFEMAEGGTIFLDEIGEMPLDLQSKLLTVVEEGTFRRVGGTKERRVNARLIAATNQDLEKRVADGKFRSDLYYRLNVFTIRIPPLRERGDDAVLLARTMLDRFCRQFGRAVPTLSPGATTAIRSHTWPGNTRELINGVQRAAMLCDRPGVEAADLGLVPGSLAGGTPSLAAFVGAGSGETTNGSESRKASPLHTKLTFDFDHGVHTADEVEKELILQALRRTHGNVSRAAKLIGMQRSSFRYRIERFHLEDAVREIARS